MKTTAKTTIRVVFVALLVFSTLGLGYSYATASTGAESTYESTGDKQVVPPRDHITVISTDSNSWLGRESDDPRSKAEVIAFAPNGSVLYYNDSHTRYWDVDPVPGTKATIEILYADHINKSECPTNWNPADYGVNQTIWNRYLNAHADLPCTRNGIERINLTTGEVTTVWSQITPGKHSTRWHDGDRLNETHYIIADIFLDRVFIVNTKTGEIGWTWNATSLYSTKIGGPYPTDWTHINDVEVLPDGRVMVSVRNMDEVVFLRRISNDTKAVMKNWTVGDDDNHSILYEQHNPDYIPPKNGGPAVVIADSENNRIIEYQRVDGEWVQTWVWKDARLQWPRDADRLPNGHTLITDSNGDRVLEVDKEGHVVWSVNVAFPYEAERLPGDESVGGPSISDAPPANYGLIEGLWLDVKDALSSPAFSATQYILPAWMGFLEFGAVVLIGLVVIIWGLIEAWWFSAPLRARLIRSLN